MHVQHFYKNHLDQGLQQHWLAKSDLEGLRELLKAFQDKGGSSGQAPACAGPIRDSHSLIAIHCCQLCLQYTRLETAAQV